MTDVDFNLLKKVFAVVKNAGDTIADMRKHHDPSTNVTKDEDGYVSILTQGDLASSDILYAGISSITPDWPVITEENVYDEMQKHGIGSLRHGYHWSEDPIDGTAHYDAGRDTYMILSSLIKDGECIMSLVYQPAKNEGYFAIKGQGAFAFQGDLENNRRLFIEKRDTIAGIEVSFEGKYFDKNRVIDAVGEQRIKNIAQIFEDEKNGFAQPLIKSICTIAENKLDLAPFLMDKSAAGEWDIAPLTLIMKEAGGHLTHLDGSAIVFGTPDKKVDAFVAYADPAVFKEFQRGLFAQYNYSAETRLFTKKETSCSMPSKAYKPS